MRINPSRLLGFVLGLLLAVHLVLLGFFRISDGDTWWHLKQGELYVTTRSLPTQDPFAFTTAGREWIKYSWVTDVLFYLVFAVLGLPGLVLLLPRDVLAAVAERRGAWAEARDQLRMILARLRPDDGEAQDIGRRLEAAERSLQAEGSR